MKHTFLLSLIFLISTSFVRAQTGWGADASGAIFNRSGTSGSTSPGYFGDSSASGGDGVSMDSATGTEARGTFSSSASLLSDLSSFMSISTRAETFLNASVQAQGEAVDTFTNGGTSTASFTIDVNLSGTLINTTNDPSDFAGNFAKVYIGFTAPSSYDEAASGIGELWFPDDSRSLEQSAAATTLTGSFTFDLAPGETVTVYANGWSQMYGENGIADASNTLTVGFSDGPTGDLVRTGTAVAIPEPGAFGLLLGMGSLLALIGQRRRQSLL